MKNNSSFTHSEIIVADNLSIGFQSQPLVSSIRLAIRSGEFIGIFGQNGAGKSTFLKTLLGFIPPLSGEIRVLGQKPSHGHIAVGYMPQLRTPLFAANLTSRALLSASYQGACYGIPLFCKSKNIEIKKMLELVQASDYADRPFNKLSGGEKQRIFLAQALLDSPRILLLDEPLSNLDLRYQEIFVNLLRAIQKELNVTILFTAHDPNPLLPAMDRVLFFAKGKAVIGRVGEVITSMALSALYETSIEVIRLSQRLFVLSNGQNVLGEMAHHDG